jgi:hypothetical protein
MGMEKCRDVPWRWGLGVWGIGGAFWAQEKLNCLCHFEAHKDWMYIMDQEIFPQLRAYVAWHLALWSCGVFPIRVKRYKTHTPFKI